ncbi:MAG: ATP-binding protein, partial [Acidimicrobiia bacterium]|nr:ATP-binding protein [Acidimicrobiia bacterium]
IFAAGLRLQSVQGLADNPLVSERVGETVTQLDETIAELRNAIFRLNTPTISATGRLDAIIDNAASHLGFRPTLNITGDPDDLPLAVVDQLEPALSEALANVYRHASATKVEIDLVVGEDSMVLTVADNGVGFDPRGPRGSGLDNLEARALRLGGTSSVASTTGKGTAVTWTAIF